MMKFLQAILDLVVSAFYGPDDEDNETTTLQQQIDAALAEQREIERVQAKAAAFDSINAVRRPAEFIGYAPQWGQTMNLGRAGAEL